MTQWPDSFSIPGSYLSLRSDRKVALGGLINVGLVQKTQDLAILVIPIQLLQICSRCKRRELELSKQFIIL